MAERRMFAKTIIDSDAFLDMPITSQALYFHLSMRADDDGFINNPKKIMRMVGCSEDDLKLLLAKSFVIGFESGVIVIKHWKIHNYIRTDRYKPTVYEEEKSRLEAKGNKAYTFKNTSNTSGIPEVSKRYPEGIPEVSKRYTQVRLGKVSIGKDSIEEEGSNLQPQPLPEINADSYEIISLWNMQKVTQDIDAINPLSKREANTRLCINGNIERFLDTIRSLDDQAFFKKSAQNGRKLRYDWFVEPDNYQKVIEGNYTDKYKEPNKSKKTTAFNNFQQRGNDADFAELEKKLFNR